MNVTHECAANTDREIWRKGGGDGNGMSYYEPSIHVTQDEAIGMNVGGTVVTMPVETWHQMAVERVALKLPQRQKPGSLRRSWGWWKRQRTTRFVIWSLVLVSLIVGNLIELFISAANGNAWWTLEHAGATLAFTAWLGMDIHAWRKG